LTGDELKLNMKNFKYTAPIAVALALGLAIPSYADEGVSGNNKYTAILLSSTVAEMPAKAADLVAHADPSQLEKTTVAVVKAAVGLNPAAAANIVGNISRLVPSMAATAAATAAGLVPHLAASIARAAAAVVPAKAGAIVEAVCRVVPAAYPNVATAVAQVAPSAGKDILAGIAVAIPALKTSVDQALVAYDSGTQPAVSDAVLGMGGANPLPPVVFAASPSSGGSVNLLPQGPSSGPPGTTIVGPAQAPPGTPEGGVSP
jgi:hypothetical protein